MQQSEQGNKPEKKREGLEKGSWPAISSRYACSPPSILFPHLCVWPKAMLSSPSIRTVCKEPPG